MNNGMELISILLWLIHCVKAYNYQQDFPHPSQPSSFPHPSRTPHISTPNGFDGTPFQVPNNDNGDTSLPDTYAEVLKSQVAINEFFRNPIFKEERKLLLGDTAKTLRPSDQSSFQQPNYHQSSDGFGKPQDSTLRAPIGHVSNLSSSQFNPSHISSDVKQSPHPYIKYGANVVLHRNSINPLLSSQSFIGQLNKPNQFFVKQRTVENGLNQQVGAPRGHSPIPASINSRWGSQKDFNSRPHYQNKPSNLQSDYKNHKGPTQTQQAGRFTPEAGFRGPEGRFSSNGRVGTQPQQTFQELPPFTSSQAFHFKDSYEFSPPSVKDPINVNSYSPTQVKVQQNAEFFNHPSQMANLDNIQENYENRPLSSVKDFFQSSLNSETQSFLDENDMLPPPHPNLHPLKPNDHPSVYMQRDYFTNFKSESPNENLSYLDGKDTVQPYKLPSIPFEEPVQRNSRTFQLEITKKPSLEQPKYVNPAYIPQFQRDHLVSNVNPSVSSRHATRSNHKQKKSSSGLMNSATAIRSRNEDSESSETDSDSKSHSVSNSGPSENEDGFEQEEHNGFLDMGAYTDKKGSFGWYADFPVGRGHDKVTYS